MRCSRALLPARGLSSFSCRQIGHTHTRRSHPHIRLYSAFHTHLFTLSSAENRRMRTLLVRSNDTCRYPPTPSPRHAHLDPQLPPTTRLAHDAGATSCHYPLSIMHARGACPHAHSAQTQGTYSFSRTVAIHTNYKLTLFRTCAGSTLSGEKPKELSGLAVSARGGRPEAIHAEASVTR